MDKNRNTLTDLRQKIAGTPALQYVLVFVAVLLGILDLAGLLPLGSFRGGIVFIASALLFAWTLGFVRDARFKAAAGFLARAVLVAALVEVTVFQANSLHLAGGMYPQKELSLSDAVVTGIDPATGICQGGEASILFEDLEMPVGTLYFDLETDSAAYDDVTVDITDDTHRLSFRSGVASARVLSGGERSRTIPCNFSGTVHSLRVRMTPRDGETLTLHGITVNRPIPLHISLLRLLLMVGTAMFVWLMTATAWARRSITDNKRTVAIFAYSLTVVLLLCALGLANLGRFCDTEHSLQKDFTKDPGNQITREIVEAFEEGHTYLNIEPNADLLAAENPYDTTYREGYYFPWDHLLYNGKIYSYYGIAPVLVLFLPYHALTGHYFPTVWAVWLFTCIGIFFLTRLYLYFMHEFFPRMRTAPVLLGLIMMQLVSGAWFCLFKPLFYEIAQMSGFCFLVSGAYCLLRSNIIGKGPISLRHLTLSSVLLSLGVLSRPTLAIYCIAAMLPVFAGVRRLREMHTDKPIFRKAVAKYLACALVPYAILGGAQMYYNYVRFGSPLDFGIQYSLTINDFTNAQYHTHFVLIGVWNYLFAIPDFKPEFPFFDCTPVEQFNPQGYYFVATASAIGLFWKALPLFSYTRFAKAYRLSENPLKKLYAAMLFAVCIACPAIILYSIWESGYGARYCVDFAWQMLLGALVIAFLVYQGWKEETRYHLDRIFTGSVLFSLFLTAGQTYTWVFGALSPELQSKALQLARIFEVWR